MENIRAENADCVPYSFFVRVSHTHNVADVSVASWKGKCRVVGRDSVMALIRSAQLESTKLYALCTQTRIIPRLLHIPQRPHPSADQNHIHTNTHTHRTSWTSGGGGHQTTERRVVRWQPENRGRGVAEFR